MPRRNVPLATGEIYHVFNRGIDRRPTFTNKREFQRALQIIQFYRFSSPPIKLSRFLSLEVDQQIKITSNMKIQSQELVSIYAYCFMPNHFHFLLKQVAENGISQFMSKMQNSYVRYFNTKHDRVGQLFLVQFKAVRIETDEQLVHVSRYIHLNPYTSFVVKDIESLKHYQWSSLPEYFQHAKAGFCNTSHILEFYKGKDTYLKFMVDQADYQRELDKIKHLTLEN